ncbi:MAG: dUTP diphosphatase [Rhodospirillales bacterium]|jgi:dUTP pyrophosphatase|nr:dUTP diphosphatase [Rhodospirillales bacterium]
MSAVNVSIKRLPGGEGLPLPSYATTDSAGMDLLASVESTQTLQAGEYAIIPSGIAIALPQGYEAQVRPRSGLAAKHGIGVLNSPGTIDADYRGEIGVILINHGKQPFVIERGMRIAQMVIAPYSRCQWQETDALEDSVRGAGGFGSTGTSGAIGTSTT